MHEVTDKQLAKRERRLLRKAEKEKLLQIENEKQEMQRKKRDERYMKQAITQARKAAAIGEVPIGCVIVFHGKEAAKKGYPSTLGEKDVVIARGYNRRNTDKSTLSHAEITAIKKASRKLEDWRLEDCTMYVTLEPCQMCAGAIVQARIPEVVIGAMNPKAGCAGSIINLLAMQEFNHQVNRTIGVCEEECSKMLKDFFASLRKRI